METKLISAEATRANATQAEAIKTILIQKFVLKIK